MRKPTVAVIGASSHRHKFGNKSLRAHLAKGYEVFPVNPNEPEVEGIKAYPSVLDIPVEHLNRVTVYLPPAVTLSVLPDIASKGCDELWLNPGTESEEVVAKAKALGLDPIQACSIVDLGISPHELQG